MLGGWSAGARVRKTMLRRIADHPEARRFLDQIGHKDTKPLCDVFIDHVRGALNEDFEIPPLLLRIFILARSWAQGACGHFPGYPQKPWATLTRTFSRYPATPLGMDKAIPTSCWPSIEG